MAEQVLAGMTRQDRLQLTTHKGHVHTENKCLHIRSLHVHLSLKHALTNAHRLVLYKHFVGYSVGRNLELCLTDKSQIMTEKGHDSQRVAKG